MPEIKKKYEVKGGKCFEDAKNCKLGSVKTNLVIKVVYKLQVHDNKI